MASPRFTQGNVKEYKIMKNILLLFLAMQMLACSSGLDGTYAGPMGISKYEFKSNGSVTITSLGTVVEAEYSIDGDKLKLGGPQGTLIMTILEDGTIRGPMGIPLRPIQQ